MTAFYCLSVFIALAALGLLACALEKFIEGWERMS